MPSFGLRKKCCLFAAAAVLLIGSSSLRLLAEEYSSPSDGIRSMEYAEGRLSLELQDASLDKVLSELSRMAMLTIIADGPIEGRITLHADHLPLEKALRKLLRGQDTSFVYTAKAETSPTEYEIKEVRIYLSNSEKGETHRYSYANGNREREDNRRSPRPPSGALRTTRRGPGPRPPTAAPRLPDMAANEETQKILSELMEGNLDGLDEIAEKFKDADPQVEEQIDEFLESLEETRRKAEESGTPMPSMERLGDMQTLMKRMLEKGKLHRGQERD